MGKKKKIMHGKIITSLVYALCVLCLPACASKSERGQGVSSNKEAGSQGISQGTSQAGGVVPSDDTKLFRGEVGEYKIEMRLARAGDRLTGTYAYETVGTSINLNGTIDEERKFTLQESDSGGKQTGVFKGTWSEAVSGATLEGTWTKAGGSEGLSFYLTEQHVNFSGGLKMVARVIKEEDKKKSYTLAAEYPQIEGSTDANVDKFNKEVSGFVTGEVDEWRGEAGIEPGEDVPGEDTTIGDDLTIRYDVRLATNDLVSIEFWVSTYEHGAAHPLTYSKVVNFDLKNGRSLQLADLFEPNANYLETIASYSINDLKRQSKEAGPDESLLSDDDIEEGASAKADNYRSWNITPKGLLITFDAYQVGPYAAGPQWAVVPYAALKEIIRADGPLAPFAQ
jgi:hypothetical protein